MRFLPGFLPVRPELEVGESFGFKEKHILGDIGKPIEIAKLVEFIANDNNGRFLNGSNIIIDGGVSARLSTE